MGRRIGIIGPRLHGRQDQVEAFARGLPAGTVVVSGAGEGVDTWAAAAARAAGHEVVEHRPAAMRRDALLARNALVAGDVDELHAYLWLGSRGTHHTIGLARARGVPVIEHPMEPRCEVWTARWGLRGDPDVLNIMREWVDRRGIRPVAAHWGNMPRERRSRLAVSWWDRWLAENAEVGGRLLGLDYAAARAGVPAPGEAFAPSMSILGPALAARREAADMLAEVAVRNIVTTGGLPAEQLAELAQTARAVTEQAWGRYVPAFTDEMRASCRAGPLLWGWLLTRPRVTLACKCPNPERCHRGIVAGLLSKFGATVRGERL